MLSLVKGYVWRGFYQDGKSISGTTLNKELKVMRVQLQQRGILVTQFHPVWRFMLKRQLVSMHETAQFSQQLAHLLQADFPLIPALDCLIDQYPSRSPMHPILIELKLALESGMAFSDALSQHPTCFNRFYCYMVHVSEQCGMLPKQLTQLADHCEKLIAIKRSTIKALYYPISLLSIACMVVILLLLLVVPRFEDLFYNVGATLPFSTRFLIKSARWLQHYGYLLGLSALSIRIFLVIFGHKMQRWIDPLRGASLKLPWIGAILRQAILARFCYTLSTTLSAGLPLLKSLTLTQEMMDYSLYRAAILQVTEAIKSGTALDQALQEHSCFPPLLVQTVAIGQSSDHLENSLGKLAQLLETRVMEATTYTIGIIEPVLLTVLGVVIGLLMLALYWPIFELGNVVGLA